LRRLLPFLVIVLFLTACGGGSGESDNPTPNAEPSDSGATSAPIVVTSQANGETTEEVAATVNGEPITVAELEEQVALYEMGAPLQAADRNALIGQELEDRIDQKLIEQAAVGMGITITEEQIQAEIEALEAEATAQGLSLEDFFAGQGISPEQYPERIREALLTEAVNASVIAVVPETGPQVHARHILVKDPNTAREVLDRLSAGEDFVALAAQYSQDPSTKDAGGDLGWISPGDLLQAEVEAAIFTLPANSRAPEPVQSVLGYHIIEAIERGEGRPLDPVRLAEQRQQAWLSWLDEQRTAAEIVRFVGPNAQQ
jgi:parvulin-like peptidyl-prolyl isomerase